jgi:hypothetical protein
MTHVDGKTKSRYVDTRTSCGQVPRTAAEHLEQGLRLMELATDDKTAQLERYNLLLAAENHMTAAGVRQQAALTEAMRPKLDPQQVGRLWRIVTEPGALPADLVTALREYGIGIVGGAPIDQDQAAAAGAGH